MHPPSERDRIIEHALRRSARTLERAPHGGWHLTVANGTVTPLRARVAEEDWLVVTAPYSTADGSWGPLLRLNASLGGSARVVRTSDGRLEVRAEIFVGDVVAEPPADPDAASIADRLAATCDDVARAAHGAVAPAIGEASRAGSDQRAADRLVRICGDAGWGTVVRGPDTVHVPIDTGADTYEAMLALDAGARLQARVALIAFPPAPGASHDAVALLLLEAGAHLRTMAGCAIRSDDGDVGAIAVAAERTPATPGSIDRALTALQVACATLGREVRALQDARLAATYLALRHAHRIAHRAPFAHTRHPEDTSCLQLPS